MFNGSEEIRVPSVPLPKMSEMMLIEEDEEAEEQLSLDHISLGSNISHDSVGSVYDSEMELSPIHHSSNTSPTHPSVPISPSLGSLFSSHSDQPIDCFFSGEMPTNEEDKYDGLPDDPRALPMPYRQKKGFKGARPLVARLANYINDEVQADLHKINSSEHMIQIPVLSTADLTDNKPKSNNLTLKLYDEKQKLLDEVLRLKRKVEEQEDEFNRKVKVRENVINQLKLDLKERDNEIRELESIQYVQKKKNDGNQNDFFQSNDTVQKRNFPTNLRVLEDKKRHSKDHGKRHKGINPPTKHHKGFRRSISHSGERKMSEEGRNPRYRVLNNRLETLSTLNDLAYVLSHFKHLDTLALNSLWHIVAQRFFNCRGGRLYFIKKHIHGLEYLLFQPNMDSKTIPFPIAKGGSGRRSRRNSVTNNSGYVQNSKTIIPNGVGVVGAVAQNGETIELNRKDTHPYLNDAVLEDLKCELASPVFVPRWDSYADYKPFLLDTVVAKSISVEKEDLLELHFEKSDMNEVTFSNEIVAVLDCYDKVTGFFNSEDRLLIQQMAKMFGQTICNLDMMSTAMLHDRLRKNVMPALNKQFLSISYMRSSRRSKISPLPILKIGLKSFTDFVGAFNFQLSSDYPGNLILNLENVDELRVVSSPESTPSGAPGNTWLMSQKFIPSTESSITTLRDSINSSYLFNDNYLLIDLMRVFEMLNRVSTDLDGAFMEPNKLHVLPNMTNQELGNILALWLMQEGNVEKDVQQTTKTMSPSSSLIANQINSVTTTVPTVQKKQDYRKTSIASQISNFTRNNSIDSEFSDVDPGELQPVDQEGNIVSTDMESGACTDAVSAQQDSLIGLLNGIEPQDNLIDFTALIDQDLAEKVSNFSDATRSQMVKINHAQGVALSLLKHVIPKELSNKKFDLGIYISTGKVNMGELFRTNNTKIIEHLRSIGDEAQCFNTRYRRENCLSITLMIFEPEIHSPVINCNHKPMSMRFAQSVIEHALTLANTVSMDVFADERKKRNESLIRKQKIESRKEVIQVWRRVIGSALTNASSTLSRTSSQGELRDSDSTTSAGTAVSNQIQSMFQPGLAFGVSPLHRQSSSDVIATEKVVLSDTFALTELGAQLCADLENHDLVTFIQHVLFHVRKIIGCDNACVALRTDTVLKERITEFTYLTSGDDFTAPTPQDKNVMVVFPEDLSNEVLEDKHAAINISDSYLGFIQRSLYNGETVLINDDSEEMLSRHRFAQWFGDGLLNNYFSLPISYCDPSVGGRTFEPVVVGCLLVYGRTVSFGDNDLHLGLFFNHILRYALFKHHLYNLAKAGRTFEMYLNAVLNNTSEHVLWIDENGYLQNYNSSLLQFLEITKDRLSDPVVEVLANFSMLSWDVGRFLESPSPSGQPYQYREFEINGKTVNYKIQSVFDGSVFKGLLVMIEDISTQRKIMQTLSRYLSSSVASQVVSVDNLKLGGNRQIATVFFADIRSYTKISEGMDAEDIVKMLNEYFTFVVDAIFAERGVLDKFIGDAVMAVWGVPIPSLDDSVRACKVVFKILDDLKKFNEEREEVGKIPIKVGIGISTGTVLSGNIGCIRRLEYTVIGDTVNLASRLEGVTKAYGVTCVISESTYKQVKNSFIVRELDVIRVIGKRHPERIFELIAPSTARLSRPKVEVLSCYATGLDLYRRKHWVPAAAFFEKALEVDPNDGPSIVMNERIKKILRENLNPTSTVWDMKSK
ncbi:hypothetical protein PCE1_003138 [Barthelona sp. PCE]